MSPENMDSFAEVLKARKDPQQLKLLLRIVKRLVSQLLKTLKFHVSFIELDNLGAALCFQIIKRV